MKNEQLSNEIVISEELIVLDFKAEDQEAVIKNLSGKLYDLGYVTEQFYPSISKREKEYPTGIRTNSIGVAIPHTEIENVKQGSIIVGVLEEPVTFKEMVTLDEIDVNVVFMLAFEKSHHQLVILQRLMNILQDEGSLMTIYNAKSKAEVVSVLRGTMMMENA